MRIWYRCGLRSCRFYHRLFSSAPTRNAHATTDLDWAISAYFPDTKEKREKIDPVGRILKLCPLNVDAHSFFAITDGGDGGYWWHCFDCHRNYDRAEHPPR
jgi:hypothetical protein